MKTPRSTKAFETMLASLADGTIGLHNHNEVRETAAALRKFRDSKSDDAVWTTLRDRIVAAEESGMKARAALRNGEIADLNAKIAEERAARNPGLRAYQDELRVTFGR